MLQLGKCRALCNKSRFSVKIGQMLQCKEKQETEWRRVWAYKARVQLGPQWSIRILNSFGKWTFVSTKLFRNFRVIWRKISYDFTSVWLFDTKKVWKTSILLLSGCYLPRLAICQKNWICIRKNYTSLTWPLNCNRRNFQLQVFVPWGVLQQ